MKTSPSFPFQISGIHRVPFFAWLLCGLASAGWAGSPAHTSRKTLDQPAEIQGYPCAKGYAWFYDNGSLNRCTMAREAAFGEARIPAGSIIALNPDGSPVFVQMSHDAPILGLTCLGGSWFGPAEGAMVGFYPSGKLKQCYLAGDQTVQGIPCMNGGFFGDGRGGGVKFRESGKLQSCKLSRDFGSLRRGDRFVQAP
jgi:hypothetical protein